MTSSVLEHDLKAWLLPLTDEESVRLASLITRYDKKLLELSQLIYEPFTEAEKKLFVLWFAKRWANINRVPREDYETYLNEVERVRSHPYEEQELEGRPYKRLTLAPQGFQGELLTYPWMLGIHDFLFGQYQNDAFRVQPGDVIIDAGAFVGDTAVLFHQQTQGNCQIHAFEVLDENLLLLAYNLQSNSITQQVHICPQALTARSGETVHIKASPIQGATSIFGDTLGKNVPTITIDDYADQFGLSKIDFIKMDIEGAERMALQGSMQTIKRYRPRLAICIYHLWDDAYEIPRIIASCGIPYHYAFKWVELAHGWEAVLLCTPRDKQ